MEAVLVVAHDSGKLRQPAWARLPKSASWRCRV